MARIWGKASVVGLTLLLVLTGCVRPPMSATLPPLVEERVPGAYGVEFRAGSTATPGLQSIEVSFKLDRPVSGDDLAAVIDAVFETNSLPLVHQVSIAAYTEDTDDGFGCVDLEDAIGELGLGDFAFAPWECTRLLADFDDLRERWEQR